MKKIGFMLVEDIREIALQLVALMVHALLLLYQFAMTMVMVLFTDHRIKKGHFRRQKMGGVIVELRSGFQKVGVLLWTFFTVWLSRIALALLSVSSYMFASGLKHATIATETKWTLDGIIYDIGYSWKDWLIENTATGAFMHAHPNNWFQFAILVGAIIGIILYVCLVITVFHRLLAVFLGRKNTSKKSAKVTSIVKYRKREIDAENYEETHKFG